MIYDTFYGAARCLRLVFSNRPPETGIDFIDLFQGTPDHVLSKMALAVRRVISPAEDLPSNITRRGFEALLWRAYGKREIPAEHIKKFIVEFAVIELRELMARDSKISIRMIDDVENLFRQCAYL